jgi:mRNA interferase RelE/StbE
VIWRVQYSKKAQKQLMALDASICDRIDIAIQTKLIVDPKAYLEPLAGSLRGLSRFRVGDWRLVCLRQEDVILVTIVRVEHRSQVYR